MPQDTPNISSRSPQDIIPEPWESFNEKYAFLLPGHLLTPEGGDAEWKYLGIYAEKKFNFAPVVIYNPKAGGNDLAADLLPEGPGTIRNAAGVVFLTPELVPGEEVYEIELICVQASDVHYNDDHGDKAEWYASHLDVHVGSSGNTQHCALKPTLDAVGETPEGDPTFPIGYRFPLMQLAKNEVAVFLSWANEKDGDLNGVLCQDTRENLLAQVKLPAESAEELFSNIDPQAIGRRLIDWSDIGDDMLVPSATIFNYGAIKYISENYPDGLTLYRKSVGLEKDYRRFEIIGRPEAGEKKEYAEAIVNTENRYLTLEYFLRVSQV